MRKTKTNKKNQTTTSKTLTKPSQHKNNRSPAESSLQKLLHNKLYAQQNISAAKSRQRNRCNLKPNLNQTLK